MQCSLFSFAPSAARKCHHSLPLLFLLMLTLPQFAADAPPAPAPSPEGTVRVASLVYDHGKTSHCFAAGFLTAVSRETKMQVDRAFHKIDLTAGDLFNYPFAVMTGEDAFDLSDAEIQALKTYIDRGGFILASAGCSNAAWAASFRAALAKAFPDRKLKAVPLDHRMFHTIYDIKEIRGKKQEGQGPETDAEVDMLQINGRVAIVFSPLGLNDTGNAGGDCCCCGGNEVRDAELINADILAYALTH